MTVAKKLASYTLELVCRSLGGTGEGTVRAEDYTSVYGKN